MESLEHLPVVWHPRTVAASCRGGKSCPLSVHICAARLACEANRPVLSSSTVWNACQGSAHSTSSRCLERDRFGARSSESPPAVRLTENRVRSASLHLTAKALQLDTCDLAILSTNDAEFVWHDANVIAQAIATKIAPTGAYVLRNNRVPAPMYFPGAWLTTTIFSWNWGVDRGNQVQGMAEEQTTDTVARMYRLFAGTGGAEVSPIAGGGSTVRFLSNGMKVDTDAPWGDTTGHYAALKSLSVDVFFVAGTATTSVTALLHPKTHAGVGPDPFVAQEPDVHVLRAVNAISEEVDSSCAPAAVKPRIMRAVAAYVRSGSLVPAFRVVQAIQPDTEGGSTRIVFANVRRCTWGFLSHLVSDVECGMTRAVYNSNTLELEMWFATPIIRAKEVARGEDGPPAKRRKGAFASVIKWFV